MDIASDKVMPHPLTSYCMNELANKLNSKFSPVNISTITYLLLLFYFSFSFKGGPAMLMIDATGRLPMEGMLSDYYPIVGQVYSYNRMSVFLC